MALVVGQKYVPHSKTRGISLANSGVWFTAQKKNQPFLYYTGCNSDNDHCFNHTASSEISGDFFNESDVTLYSEHSTLYAAG